MFFTVLTRAHHLILAWARWIQSMSLDNFNINFSSTLGYPTEVFMGFSGRKPAEDGDSSFCKLFVRVVAVHCYI
jgi:hypothetical protein